MYMKAVITRGKKAIKNFREKDVVLIQASGLNKIILISRNKLRKNIHSKKLNLRTVKLFNPL